MFEFLSIAQTYVSVDLLNLSSLCRQGLLADPYCYREQS